MNILMLTNTYLPHVGGVARSVASFFEAFGRAGHRVLVVAPEFAGAPEEERDVIRVPAIQNFNGSDFSVRLPVPGLLTQRLERFRPDVTRRPDRPEVDRPDVDRLRDLRERVRPELIERVRIRGLRRRWRRLRMMPSACVIASYTVPDGSCVAVTLAPGMTCPCASLTRPCMAAVVTPCA